MIKNGYRYVRNIVMGEDFLRDCVQECGIDPLPLFICNAISLVAAIIFLSIKISAAPKSCTYLLNLIFFIYKE